MRRDDSDDSTGSLTKLLADAVLGGFGAQDREGTGSATESLKIRLLKCGGLLLILAVTGGAIGAALDLFWDLQDARRQAQHSERIPLKPVSAVEDDPLASTRSFFYIGAGIGAAIGLAYTVKTLATGRDP